MVDLYVCNTSNHNNMKNRIGLSESNHERTRSSSGSFHHRNNINSSLHLHRSTHGGMKNGASITPYTNNSNNLGLNGSNHGVTVNTLNGSSTHSRSGNNNTAYRNKSFNKPRTTSNNPVYDPLNTNSNHSTRSTSSAFLHSYKKPDLPQKSQYIAMDCEMVGTITGESVAARVVLIDWKGRVVLDLYMKPNIEIADYRTFVSGITKEHLEDAISFNDGQKKVEELLKDKILVGHGVDNDLRALNMVHPWLMTRDTAYYQPFMRTLENGTTNPSNTTSPNSKTDEPVWGPRKLKDLAKEKLQREIQVPGVSHCPVEDALAALDLYKSHRPRWEACMSSEERQQQQYVLQMAAARVTYDYEYNNENYNHKTTTATNGGNSSHHYTSTVTPPRRRSSHNISPTSSDLLSVSSMHSICTYDSCLDTGSMHSHSPALGPFVPYHHQQHQHQHQQHLSLDSNTFHGSSSPYINSNNNNQNRPQFHRSSSMTESSVNCFVLPAPTLTNVRNKSFHRQLSLEYEPTYMQSSLDYTPQRVFQRQSSLEYAPPGLPNKTNESKYSFARDVNEESLFRTSSSTDSSSCSSNIAPPPGF